MDRERVKEETASRGDRERDRGRQERERDREGDREERDKRAKREKKKSKKREKKEKFRCFVQHSLFFCKLCVSSRHLPKRRRFCLFIPKSDT